MRVQSTRVEQCKDSIPAALNNHQAQGKRNLSWQIPGWAGETGERARLGELFGWAGCNGV
jgi:hypothetical protein